MILTIFPHTHPGNCRNNHCTISLAYQAKATSFRVWLIEDPLPSLGRCILMKPSFVHSYLLSSFYAQLALHIAHLKLNLSCPKLFHPIFLTHVFLVLALSSCCCKTFHFLNGTEILAFVFQAYWLCWQSLYSLTSGLRFTVHSQQQLIVRFRNPFLHHLTYIMVLWSQVLFPSVLKWYCWQVCVFINVQDNIFISN